MRIKAGECVPVDAYLARFADLAADPDAVLELVEAELTLRRRSWPRPEIRQSTGRSRPMRRPGRRANRPVRTARRDRARRVRGDLPGVGHGAGSRRGVETAAMRRLDVPGAIERFLREARSTATLRHPQIVPVFDAGQFEGSPYLVSALVEGRNLARELADRRPGFRQSAEWVAALAEALEHAHEQGVIHRDVKPSNVLIDREGRVYLTDFGLAKCNTGEATLTIDGQVLGTPAYMAPEQARGIERAGRRADRRLQPGGRPLRVADRRPPVPGERADAAAPDPGGGPDPPRRLDDAVPRDLETICLKAMAKAPGHRYPDAASFAADLRRYLRGEPVRRPAGADPRVPGGCAVANRSSPAWRRRWSWRS